MPVEAMAEMEEMGGVQVTPTAPVVQMHPMVVTKIPIRVPVAVVAVAVAGPEEGYSSIPSVVQ